jgi:hypothetical protein
LQNRSQFSLDLSVNGQWRNLGYKTVGDRGEFENTAISTSLEIVGLIGDRHSPFLWRLSLTDTYTFSADYTSRGGVSVDADNLNIFNGEVAVHWIAPLYEGVVFSLVVSAGGTDASGGRIRAANTSAKPNVSGIFTNLEANFSWFISNHFLLRFGYEATFGNRFSVPCSLTAVAIWRF